jgi:hypothetical protein
MLPKKKGVPYFTSCSQGAEEAAKELGNVDLVYDGPTDGAPEKAAAMIEKCPDCGVSSSTEFTWTLEMFLSTPLIFLFKETATP